MEPASVGSLVAPSPRYRASMETGEDAALLLATRRGSGLLYYAGTDRSYWVPTREIAPIPSEVLPDDSRERVLSDLLLYLCCEECGIETLEGDHITLTVRAPRLTRTQLVILTGTMGEMLGDMACDPGSMSGIALRIELAHLPPPAGAVR